MTDAPSSAGETRARAGSSADRKTTITQTQARFGAAGGGAIALEYAIACIQAHSLIVPTLDQAAGILIVGGPFFHLVGRIVMYWVGRLLPKDANTGD